MGKTTANPTIRILMLGAEGVGKNCLESRFTTMTYPPPYDPALTLNSRRFFTLSPAPDWTSTAAGAPHQDELPTSAAGGDDAKKAAVVVSAVERPQTESSTASVQAAAAGTSNVHSSNNINNNNNNNNHVENEPEPTDPAATAADTFSLDDRTLVASETCSECAREHNTYLVEVINYPSLQSPRVRAQVHGKANYDAVLLVYDVADRASFDAVAALHVEIPVCTRKNHHFHHRKAAPHTSATRSRTSGWFGGGGNETGTTGSGEIVVGLVGNKSDCDDHGDGDDNDNNDKHGDVVRDEYINGRGPLAKPDTPTRLDADADADAVEHSLLHPRYRESILYEELMSGLAAQKKNKTKKQQPAAAATTSPTTPFFVGDAPQSPGTQPLSPKSGTGSQSQNHSQSKNEDIEKWLQISKLEKPHNEDDDRDNNETGASMTAAVGSRAADRHSAPTARTTTTTTTPMSPAGDDSGRRYSTGTTADDIVLSSAAARQQQQQQHPSTPSPPPPPPPRPFCRQVPTADGEALAHSLQLPVPFCETSAKTGRNVEAAFENLIREVLREMGRDASGTNKAGKTCRHKARKPVVAVAAAGAEPTPTGKETKPQTSPMLPKHTKAPPDRHQDHNHDHNNATAVASVLGGNGAGGRVDTAATIQRPRSATLAGGKANNGNNGGADHDKAAATVGRPVAPRTQRRASMMDRMRQVFVKKQHPQPVLRTDIAA
ncbi:Small GTPase superfamily [Niveomyces insectorum RCEF 264]|uniref:Small GTPase superfamily n=1 Tax=Niveomyces insectorum RCEF 264 TaxID=1081102 RepID=A0A167YX42_9HYPO|nr:Small GTPase superfamily [Niveomyces insectorum RCEF 264]